ncbi:MAG: TIR domain-containing protein [Caulobacteraceae bacterium]
MSEIFVSYARSTAVQAGRIAEALRSLGYGVWRDDELPAHRSYSEVIEERLRAARAVIVVWSAEAVKSQWVRAEADAAREAGTLVQLSIDGSVPPMPFNQIQCADMADWAGDMGAPGWRKVEASIADLAGSARAGPARSPQKSARSSKPSICVLPFANISDDPQQEYFSDGISEDIITDLSKVSALTVTSRNTAFSFKGKDVEVGEIARRLGVSHVLEGSVRKAGSRVRITAQLIEGVSDSHAWAERWDRDLTDIFALQDEISQAIVGALKLRLLPEEKREIEKRGTDSVEAYTLYLMARQQKSTGNEGDPRRDEAIIRLCQRAVAIDPQYARAWAMLAFGQNVFRAYRGDVGEDGLAAAERAVELDPSLAEARARKARILFAAGRRDEAHAELAAALALDAGSLDVVGIAAEVAYRENRLEEAERYFVVASALDASAFGQSGLLMSIRRALGNVEGAREAAKMTLDRIEPVLAQFPNNGNALAHGAGALAELGLADRAREWMDRALLLDADNLTMRYNFACVLANQLGDREGALDLLGPVLERASTGLVSLVPADPDLASIREDPRFQAMLAEAEARLSGV